MTEYINSQDNTKNTKYEHQRVFKFDEYLAQVFLEEKEKNSQLEATNRSLIEVQSQLEATEKQSLAYAHDIQKLYIQLKEHFVSTMAAMIRTIEARDAYTRGHSDRVTEYTLQIARAMNYSEHDLQTLEIAGQIHDIGKIGIPDAILNKPGKLTDEEFDVIKTHVTIGPELVDGLDFLKEAKKIAFAHHENWDGQGYPHGLKGEETPLGARIMAVADSYDAMTSDRPYRKGMPKEKAMAILQEGAGTRWDKKIVDIFLVLLSENNI